MLSRQLRRYLTLIALSGPRSGLEPDPRTRVGGLKLPGESVKAEPWPMPPGAIARRQAITLAPNAARLLRPKAVVRHPGCFRVRQAVGRIIINRRAQVPWQ